MDTGQMDQNITYTLSPGQRALWFINHISPDRCAYNINLAWHIRFDLDIRFLKSALLALSHQHPNLRTTYFANQDGTLQQKVWPDMPLNFQEIDSTGWSEGFLKKNLKQETIQPFDLENGPVSRWKLFRLNRTEGILFFSIHHIATDYAGIIMMFSDLSAWLEKGKILTIKTPGQAGYGDFVDYLNKKIEGPRGKTLQKYWERQLKEHITPLNLPLDKPRPPVQNFRGEQISFPIPNRLYKNMIKTARTAGISLYTYFLSIFTLLLHRYSGQDTILVSSPVSSRTPRFKHLSGYCVNPVVLKADFSDNPSIEGFLEKMQKRVMSAFYHKDYPFVNLSETFQPDRDPGIPPIAQVMYNHVDFNTFRQKDRPLIRINADAVIQWQMGETVWNQLDLRGQTDEFDLVLETCMTESRALIHLQYNENLFKPDTIKQMGTHYLNLLSAMTLSDITTASDKRIDRLPMLTSEESRLILSDWAGTSERFEKNACVPTWFEDQVELTPDAPALIHQKETLTFRELDIRANQIGNYLKRHGAGPETLVGICMDRGPLTVACLMGILKCGAAYIPLDPLYPADRLAYIIQDSGLRLILTQSGHRDCISREPVRVICVDEAEKAIQKEPEQSPDPDLSLSNLAYVIYTSGSTGNPKGVAIEHRGVSALINSYARIFPKEDLSGVLTAASLSFDLSVLDLLMPLVLGGTLVLAEHPMVLPLLPARNKIRLILAVPSTIRALLRVNGIPDSVTTIAMGGDYLKKELVNELYGLGHVKQVFNLYGPTEETVAATFAKLPPGLKKDPPIGKPLAKTQAYILDRRMQPVPVGVPGELYLGGDGLARGYLNRPDLTREKFISHPFSEDPAQRLYRTGDLASFLPDGQIRYQGRMDFQVKIRGFRIELEEVEAVIQSHERVAEALVTVGEDRTGEKILLAHVVPDASPGLTEKEIRLFLKDRLPAHMVPTFLVLMDAFPLNQSGKIDRNALPKPDVRDMEEAPPKARNGSVMQVIADIWKEVLGLASISLHDNFFDIGGHSLLMVSVFTRLKQVFETDISLVDLYKYTTVQSLADFLTESMVGEDRPPSRIQTGKAPSSRIFGSGDTDDAKVAIIGIACRYPGASDKDAFWENIENKKDCISTFSEREMAENGIPLSMRRHKDFVPKSGWIDGLERFDADFFNITPAEARIIDPQHRIFMECAWEALEDAGIDLDRTDDITGIYAGCGQNAYYTHHLSQDLKLRQQMGDFNLMIGNSNDFLGSRIGYKFNLKGPMPTVQTACSTSMTGVHMACKGLFTRDCDIALAGGVSLGALQKGYLYREGMILSADGQCRPFDRDATGTVPSQGAGIVVLKRLKEALRDRHHIYAVISGTAINNDGIGKAGFTAPSVSGQAAVIRSAQQRAGITPAQISYIEAHGTGTSVGDPIETAALETVFSGAANQKGACAVGAVKANIGHTDIASGIAGIIKTAMALKHRKLPPTIHYENPNGHIRFTDPPFYINTRSKPWTTEKLPRRAGVSSFGLGGCNAHTIMEEAGSETRCDPEAGSHLLPFSAKTETALTSMAENLERHLADHPEECLSDAAFTLQKGRKNFEFRQFIVADSTARAVERLMDFRESGFQPYRKPSTQPGVVFMFTGQGAQYPDMGKALYAGEKEFRNQADQCLDCLARIDADVLMAFKKGKAIWDTDELYQTHLTQPALFIFEYALARLLMHWGIRPDYMIGHSLGEYVAACIAGVFSLEDALSLVVQRGRLIQGLPGGEMAATGLPMAEARKLVSGDLCIAAANTPSRTVVSGPSADMADFRRRCRDRDIPCIPLKTSHAFHSAMLDPVLDRYRDVLASVPAKPPAIPIVSNVTGTWLTAAQAGDPGYWVDHMRKPVMFAPGLETLFRESDHLALVEVGPGKVLSSLALQQPARRPNHDVIQTVRSPKETADDHAVALTALGRLWSMGIDIDWDRLHHGRPGFTSLPTYPFDRKRYWVDSAASANYGEIPEIPGSRRTGAADGKPPRQKTPPVSLDDDIEQTIIRVWEEFLGHENLSVEDDFFKLGGDSLLAVMMLAHLREEFDMDISANVLINHASIAGLAGIIREKQAAVSSGRGHAGESEQIVELKSGSAFPSLFLCHPGAGHLYFYNDLANALDFPNAVYGVEAKGLHGDCDPLDNIADIAGHHLDRIMTVQASGPYCIGGSSFGGMVAYEAAQQLIDAGEEVSLLYMVDTPGPGHMMPPITSNVQIFSQLFPDIFLRNDRLEAELLELEHDIDAQIERLVQRADRSHQIPGGFGAHVIHMVRTHVDAMHRYEPKPFPGSLIFFTQRELLDGYAAFPELAWLPLVQGGVTLHTVQGNHITMNSAPNVAAIAKVLQRQMFEITRGRHPITQ